MYTEINKEIYQLTEKTRGAKFQCSFLIYAREKGR